MYEMQFYQSGCYELYPNQGYYLPSQAKQPR